MGMLLVRKAVSACALTCCPIAFVEQRLPAQGEAIPENALLTGRMVEKQCEETFHG